MKRNIRITVIACLIWVAIVLLVTYFRYAGDNTPQSDREVAVDRSASTEVSAEQLREMGARLYDEPVSLETFRLTRGSGEPFTQADLEGQWSLLFFGFTNCPDMCPVTMQALGDFYRQLQDSQWGDDTRVVFITVDPDRDGPEQVARYASGFHEDFIGVTGEHSQIGNLSRQLFLAHTPPSEAQRRGGNYDVEHSRNILMIDAAGRYRGFLEPGLSADAMLRTYRQIRRQQ